MIWVSKVKTPQPMTYRILLTALIVIISIPSLAQKPFNLIFETGVDGFFCDQDKTYDYLRASPDLYKRYYDMYNDKVSASMTRMHAAVKVEKFFLRNFAFATGVRFTHLQSSLEKNQSPQYFYLLFRQTGTTTEYLTVRELEQRASYIGVPFELRFSPYSGKRINLFATFGTDVNFKIVSKNKISFNDEAMSEFHTEASSIIGDPEKIFMSTYAKIGAVLGRNHPWASVSAMIPVYLPTSSSTLVRPEYGFGINLQFIKTF
jgi:hypothetical protein